MFEVGDEIEVIKERDDLDKGSKGIVVGKSSGTDYAVRITHAIGTPCLHNCCGKTPNEDGYNIAPTEMKKINTTENRDNNDIEVGDEVERTTEDFGDMKVGDRGIVVELDSGLTIEGRGTCNYSKNKFIITKKHSDRGVQNNDMSEQNEVKMEKPETKLEKDALEKAKKSVIEGEIEDKASMYRDNMRTFISNERSARSYRKTADELKEKLGITDTQMKDMF